MRYDRAAQLLEPRYAGTISQMRVRRRRPVVRAGVMHARTRRTAHRHGRNAGAALRNHRSPDSHARRRGACGRSPLAGRRRPVREIPGVARVPALPQGRVARLQLFAVFLFSRSRLRRRARGYSRHGQQRGRAHSLRVLGHRARRRRGRDRVARRTALVHGQGRHVRHLLGRLQLHPDGAAQSTRTQSLRRGHGYRLSLRRGRALHRRHHAHRLVDDEPRFVQRAAGRAGLRHGRGLGEEPLRREAQRLYLHARTARRSVLGPCLRARAVRKDAHPRLSHRRLVRRLSQQPAAHARARRCDR